jgi:hypothetical protein
LIPGHIAAFLSLTPAPPPFSPMNSTPAASILSRTRPRSSGRDHGSPDSKVKTVLSLTPTRNASLTEGEIVTPTLLARRFTLGHILAGGAASVAAIATPLIRACRRESRMVRPPVLSPRCGVGTGRDCSYQLKHRLDVGLRGGVRDCAMGIAKNIRTDRLDIERYGAPHRIFRRLRISDVPHEQAKRSARSVPNSRGVACASVPP